MHYASKTASASRGIPAIRLTLRNPSGFSVPAQFLVLIQNPAGGGSRRFNRFLAELAAGQICSQRRLLTVWSGTVACTGRRVHSNWTNRKDGLHRATALVESSLEWFSRGGLCTTESAPQAILSISLSWPSPAPSGRRPPHGLCAVLLHNHHGGTPSCGMCR